MVQRISCRFGGDRRELRKAIVSAFMEEDPGTGTGELCTRYIYEVEQSPSGHLVELHRPAFLNKGIDFTVRCLSVVFNEKNAHWCHVPTHDDLVFLLGSIRDQYANKYSDVANAVRAVYECRPDIDLAPLSTLIAAPATSGAEGCPADVGVLVAKWLFAEQDLTYWNNSGRAMLFGKLSAEGLV